MKNTTYDFRDIINPNGIRMMEFDRNCDEKTRIILNIHAAVLRKHGRARVVVRKALENPNALVRVFSETLKFYGLTSTINSGRMVGKLMIIRQNGTMFRNMIIPVPAGFSNMEYLLKHVSPEFRNQISDLRKPFEVSVSGTTHASEMISAIDIVNLSNSRDIVWTMFNPETNTRFLCPGPEYVNHMLHPVKVYKKNLGSSYEKLLNFSGIRIIGWYSSIPGDNRRKIPVGKFKPVSEELILKKNTRIHNATMVSFYQDTIMVGPIVKSDKEIAMLQKLFKDRFRIKFQESRFSGLK